MILIMWPQFIWNVEYFVAAVTIGMPVGGLCLPCESRPPSYLNNPPKSAVCRPWTFCHGISKQQSDTVSCSFELPHLVHSTP